MRQPRVDARPELDYRPFTPPAYRRARDHPARARPPPRPGRRRVHRARLDDRRGCVRRLLPRGAGRGLRTARRARRRRPRRVLQRDRIRAACRGVPHLRWHVCVRPRAPRPVVGLPRRLELHRGQDRELRRDGHHVRGVRGAGRLGEARGGDCGARARRCERARGDAHGAAHPDSGDSIVLVALAIAVAAGASTGLPAFGGALAGMRARSVAACSRAAGTACCSRPASCSSRSRDTPASRPWARRCATRPARSRGRSSSRSRSSWRSTASSRSCCSGCSARMGLPASSAPVADAVRASGWSWAEPVVRVGAAAASLGALLALIAGVGRTTLAMAREGDVPRWLAAVHPRFLVPHRAELALAVVVSVLVLLTDLRGAIAFSSFGVLLYYAIANLAAFTQPQRAAAVPEGAAGAWARRVRGVGGDAAGVGRRGGGDRDRRGRCAATRASLRSTGAPPHRDARRVDNGWMRRQCHRTETRAESHEPCQSGLMNALRAHSRGGPEQLVYEEAPVPGPRTARTCAFRSGPQRSPSTS